MVFRILWANRRVVSFVFPVVACNRSEVTTGPEIKAARERARLSQKDLADKLEVSERTVGNWERGETVPRNRLAAIEELLNIGTAEDVPVTAANLDPRLNNIERQLDLIWKRLDDLTPEAVPGNVAPVLNIDFPATGDALDEQAEAARSGQSTGRAMREAQDDEATQPQDDGNWEPK